VAPTFARSPSEASPSTESRFVMTSVSGGGPLRVVGFSRGDPPCRQRHWVLQRAPLLRGAELAASPWAAKPSARLQARAVHARDPRARHLRAPAERPLGRARLLDRRRLAGRTREPPGRSSSSGRRRSPARGARGAAARRPPRRPRPREIAGASDSKNDGRRAASAAPSRSPEGYLVRACAMLEYGPRLFATSTARTR
jgi:hypothetical protein